MRYSKNDELCVRMLHARQVALSQETKCSKLCVYRYICAHTVCVCTHLLLKSNTFIAGDKRSISSDKRMQNAYVLYIVADQYWVHQWMAWVGGREMILWVNYVHCRVCGVTPLHNAIHTLYGGPCNVSCWTLKYMMMYMYHCTMWK